MAKKKKLQKMEVHKARYLKAFIEQAKIDVEDLNAL
jgi:hypothetical protein